jgi:hypothetical protein
VSTLCLRVIPVSVTATARFPEALQRPYWKLQRREHELMDAGVSLRCVCAVGIPVARQVDPIFDAILQALDWDHS